MEALSEGSSFTITQTPEALKRTRYLIYAWKHIQGYSPEAYQLKCLSPTQLFIKRRVINPQPTIYSENSEPSDEIAIQFALEHLKDCKTEEQAIEIANKFRHEGTLNIPQTLNALTHWRTMKGIPR